MTKYLFFYSGKKNNIMYLKKIYIYLFFNLMVNKLIFFPFIFFVFLFLVYKINIKI